MGTHNVHQALTFLDKIKEKGGLELYQSFMDLMFAFETHQIDAPILLLRATELFEGREELMEGFDVLIPDEALANMPPSSLTAMDSSATSLDSCAMNHANCHGTPTARRKSPSTSLEQVQPMAISPDNSHQDRYGHAEQAALMQNQDIHLPLLVLTPPPCEPYTNQNPPSVGLPFPMEAQIHHQEPSAVGETALQDQDQDSLGMDNNHHLVSNVALDPGSNDTMNNTAALPSEQQGPQEEAVLGLQPSPLPASSMHKRRSAATTLPRLRLGFKKPAALLFHQKQGAAGHAGHQDQQDRGAHVNIVKQDSDQSKLSAMQQETSITGSSSSGPVLDIPVCNNCCEEYDVDGSLAASRGGGGWRRSSNSTAHHRLPVTCRECSYTFCYECLLKEQVRQSQELLAVNEQQQPWTRAHAEPQRHRPFATGRYKEDSNDNCFQLTWIACPQCRMPEFNTAKPFINRPLCNLIAECRRFVEAQNAN